MAIGIAPARQLNYKKEVTWNTAPGASAGQQLRRTQTAVGFMKDTFQSAEITPTMQLIDFRHGMKKITGTFTGELSPKTYSDFYAAIFRRNFAAISAGGLASRSITIAGAGPTYTLTDGTATWITYGLKLGLIIRLTAGSFNVANLNVNLRITALTQTVITVVPDSGTMVTEGPIATATVTVPGKVTFVAASGQTDDSFWFENWFSDITQSEQMGGCKIGQIAVTLPSQGMATNQFTVNGATFIGGTVQYLTSPIAVTTTGVCAAANGAMRVGTTDQIAVTSGSITINRNDSIAGPLVGSVVPAGVLPGREVISGQFTAFFQDNVLRDLFVAESTFPLYFYLKADGLAGGDFVNYILPYCKLGGASKDDPATGIVGTYPFQALYNSAGGAAVATEATTMMIQDSAA